MVEPWVREALIRLNPESPRSPTAPTRSSTTCAPASSRCRPMAWCGPTRTSWPGCAARRPCPLATNGEHVPVRLVDAVAAGQQPAHRHQPVDFPSGRGGEALRRGVRGQRPAAGHRRGQDAHAQRRDLVRRRLPGQRDLREASAGHVRAERLLVRHRGPPVPLRLHPHAHRHVGAVARRRQPGRRPVAARPGHGREHAAARGGARHPAALHPLRHRQEAPAHQDHLPLPAIRDHQQDRRPRGQGLPEEGPDLAFPGQRQVAADGLRRAEAAAAPASSATPR